MVPVKISPVYSEVLSTSFASTNVPARPHRRFHGRTFPRAVSVLSTPLSKTPKPHKAESGIRKLMLPYNAKPWLKESEVVLASPATPQGLHILLDHA